MSYYDWPHFIKPLTWKPVQQDTSFKKATQFAPVFDVRTTLIKIQVPSCTFTPYINPSPFVAVIPLIVGQICFSAGSNLSILNFGADTFQPVYPSGVITITIRYRVGNVVTRYKLYESTTLKRTIVFCPWYTGQLILSNFVIEIWQIDRPTHLSIVTNPFVLNTGIIYIPTNDEDAGPTIGPSAIIDYPALTDALPETLPITPAANGPWLTN